ncbi:aminotransferase [Gorgonomyces haynaldii]|nr:aminotransferase [Gorgonomyces haynaldii]
MPSVPVEMFVDACERVVRDNREFVPPFGTNGSLYIRPFVIGTGGMLGLSPSKQYKFIVAVNPVGDYYQGGIGQPVKAIIKHGFDRAAPNGTGHVKLAGNYAPAMRQSQLVKQNGYTVMLFLDCKEQQWIEEFATSNFAAIVLKNDKPVYVTPSSQSVLNSVTNRSLFELAKSLGWQVEKRPIRYEEIKTFDEIAACGTAVVITPVGQIDREFGTLQPLQADPSQWEQPSPAYDISVESIQLKSDFKYFKQLYQHYRDIQNGVQQDSMHWMYPSKGI